MAVVTHNGAEGIALRDEETFKAKMEQWREKTATHQGVLEDLDPTGSALAQLFLYPVVRGEHWTLLRAQIRGDLLGNAVGEKTAYEACHSHKPRKLSGGRAGHRNGSATTPKGDLGVRLATIKSIAIQKIILSRVRTTEIPSSPTYTDLKPVSTSGGTSSLGLGCEWI